VKSKIYDWIKEQIDSERTEVELRDIKDMRKWELEGIMEQIVNQPNMGQFIYKLDQVARLNNNVILRLPPYHCTLNPIELVWKVRRFITQYSFRPYFCPTFNKRVFSISGCEARDSKGKLKPKHRFP
jgi:hypothetical protein